MCQCLRILILQGSICQVQSTIPLEMGIAIGVEDDGNKKQILVEWGDYIYYEGDSNYNDITKMYTHGDPFLVVSNVESQVYPCVPIPHGWMSFHLPHLARNFIHHLNICRQCQQTRGEQS